MSRLIARTGLCFVLGIVAFAYVYAQQKIEGLPLNQEVVKVIPADSIYRVTDTNLVFNTFCIDVTFDLIDTKPVSIHVKAPGKNRKVGIILIDPANAEIDQVFQKLDSNTLSVPAVGDKGKYTARIYSTHIGEVKLLIETDDKNKQPAIVNAAAAPQPNPGANPPANNNKQKILFKIEQMEQDLAILKKLVEAM